jgi:hypothetical protein
MTRRTRPRINRDRPRPPVSRQLEADANREVRHRDHRNDRIKFFTIAEVAERLGAAERMSRSMLYKAWAQGWGPDPAGIPFDLPAISAKLALVNPVAAGLTAKSFSNIRSNFITAVKASGLKSINRSAGTPLSPEWRRLMRKLSGRRAHLGLSRLARFASAKGIEPAQVDDAVIEAFITAVRSGTLHRKPNELHRKVAQIWNEAVERSGLDLQAVRVPSFQSPAKRLDWTLLGRAFRKAADRCPPIVQPA